MWGGGGPFDGSLAIICQTVENGCKASLVIE